MATRKVPCPIDKREWHPSLIPGPIALISTADASGTPNVAPKSWLQMVAFDPPTLMFSGSKDGETERNALATECFAVNIVDGSMIRKTFACIQWKGEERIRESGFRLAPASVIPAPLVEDCKAHLECRLVGTKEVGSGFVIFGEIVAASIWEDVLGREPRHRYARLDQALFLEDGMYASVDRARPAVPESLSEQYVRYVIIYTRVRPDLINTDLVRAKVARLKELEAGGLLELCGPFADQRGGMVILRGVSEEEARAIAEADPFIASGAATFELRKLDVSCRDNNHMGMG